MSQIHKHKHTTRNIVFLIAGAFFVGTAVTVLLLSKVEPPSGDTQTKIADTTTKAASESEEIAPAETRAKAAAERLKQNAALAAVASTARTDSPEQVKPSSENRPLDEILAELKEILMKEPSTALEIARDALIEHPDSDKAPELEWYVVRALLELNRRPDAVAAAELMVEKYPGNSFSKDVRRHLLTPMGPPQ